MFMVSINSKKIKAYTLISMVAALVLAMVRTVMLTKIVEPDTGFYLIGSKWAGLFDWGIVILLAVMVLLGRYLLKKVKSPDELKSDSTVTVFGSALCSFMFFSVFVYGMYLKLFTDNTVGILLLLQIILCVPAGFNHLMICAKEHREKTTAQALLAMSVPVMFALRVIDVFMATDTQINTSQRSFELLMLCAVMVFYLYESAFVVNKKFEEGDNRVFVNYYVSALSAVVLTFVTVIPYLLVSVFWVFETDFVIIYVLECCVMLYAACRLLAAHK